MESILTGTIKAWADFGLAGLVILSLLGLIVYLSRQHRDERREWRAQADQQFKANQDNAKETNTVVRELTRVVEGINRG